MSSRIISGIYEGRKMMKNVFKWMIVLCCAVFAAQASVSGAARSPNIIFFLVDDLGEQRDLSKENPETTQKLLKMLQDWRQQTDAKMPLRKTADSNSAPSTKVSKPASE